MRCYLLIIFTVTIFICQAQRKMVNGRVLDQHAMGIPSVHVQNQTIRKITVSDENGNFKVPAQTGDTLLLSSVGFMSLSVIVEGNWFDRLMILTLKEGSIELDELTISSIPSIEEFKERVLNYQPKDSVHFWYFGMEYPAFKGDKMLEGKKYKSPLFAIFHPISFMHYNLSNKEKEKRKYHKIIGEQFTRQSAYKKFSRDLLQKETGLEGNELTSFIAFCNFDIYYLDRTSLFYIKEEMMAKLEEFKMGGKG